jgi:fucose 4-O-acetylase-like acetyltransferase
MQHDSAEIVCGAEVCRTEYSQLRHDAELASTTRYQWLDAAKGIGILLVVAGHACGGVIDARLPFDGWPVRQLFMGIYVFHMPLFFLLSGLLVERRVRRGRAKFLESIVTRILYPYVIWSVIQFSCIYAASGLVNAPPGDFWTQILLIPIRPVSQFWFLAALALMHAMSLLVLPRFGMMAMLLLSFVVRSLTDLGYVPGVLGEAGQLFPYYALGVLLGPVGIETLVLRHRHGAQEWLTYVAALALLVVTTAGVLAAIGLTDPSADLPWIPAAAMAHDAWAMISFGAALAMTAAVVMLADRSTGVSRTVLAYLGRMSLAIFILHILFIAGLRIVLSKLLHIDDVAIILPVIVVAGLAGPLAAATLLDRLHLARVLGLR